MVWLVLMNTAHPGIEPKFYHRFSDKAACIEAAAASNQVGVPKGSPNYTKTPNGKFWLCYSPVYPS